MKVGSRPEIQPQIERLTNTLGELNEYGGSSKYEYDFEKWFVRRCSEADVDRLGKDSAASNFAKPHMFLNDLNNVKILLGTAVEDIAVICGHIQSLYETALRNTRIDILSLPPEVLCMIFKEIREDTKSVKAAMLTCRRLRDVAIQEPALWCNIKNTDTRTHWKRCLERSAGHDLTIRIIRPRTNKYEKLSWLPKEFCQLVSKECDRWKELYIELGSSADSRFSSHGYFKKLSLPRLTTLSVEYCSYSGQPILVDGMIRGWTAPNLKCFRGLPLECTGTFMESLTTFEFIIESHALASTSPVLRSLFGRMSLCRKLKLDFFTDNENHGVIGTLPSKEPVFPELRALWLVFPPDTGNGHIVEHLLANIIPISQITELTLEIYEDHRSWRTENSMHGSFDIAAAWEFRQVRVLNLILYHMSDYKYPLTASRMPYLEHITICSFSGKEPTDRFSGLQSHGVLPLGLKTVTFKDCPNIKHDYLVDLAQTLNSAGFSETFERLDIIDCPLSTETRIELTIPLQGKFRRADTVPKKQEETNLHQKRIEFNVQRA